MLEQIQGTSEAVPESVTMAEASEASAKVIQTSDLPTSIPTPLSPSNDSDHDEMPLGQRMKMLPKPSQQPQQTTKQTPLQERQTSAAAEDSEDPEEPNTSDLPQCDPPSNLFSLERHLGGEITKTPKKAFKPVPKKTDLDNQQPPQPSNQTNPEPIQTQTHIPTKQMIIPEYVVEPSVSITISEPTQNLTLTQMTNPHHHHHHPFRSLNNHPQTFWNLNTLKLSCYRSARICRSWYISEGPLHCQLLMKINGKL